MSLHRTKCFLFDLKCTKIAGGWGSAPGPVGGAYSTPPDPLAVWEGGEGGGMGMDRWRGNRGEGGEFVILPLYLNFLVTPLDVSQLSRLSRVWVHADATRQLHSRLFLVSNDLWPLSQYSMFKEPILGFLLGSLGIYGLIQKLCKKKKKHDKGLATLRILWNSSQNLINLRPWNQSNYIG